MPTGSTSFDTIWSLDSSKPVPSVKQSFEFCEQLARSHYENFPIASFFIPKSKRPHVWSIYSFARVADDIADEGDASPEKRLQELDRWQEHLDECYLGTPSHPIFIALTETIRACGIPARLPADLLTAFRMDVLKKRFNTFDELLHYCRHSANPIGRLILHVFGNATERTATLSDSFCTALQLANFWQDVAIDWKKGRLYIPLEDMERFGYTEQDLGASIIDDRFHRLMAFEVDRAKRLFDAGRPLIREVSHELRLELSLTWKGGMKILEKIEHLEYNVLHNRPTISVLDKLSILGASLLRLK